MTIEEAMRVLEGGGWWDLLDPSGSDADLDSLHEALDVALSAIREKQSDGWISVSDALPGVYENVLVYCPNTKMVRKVEIDYLERLHWSDEWKHGPVTHWQPLPEPPKGGEEHGAAQV